MSHIHWKKDPSRTDILMIAADRSLGGALRRIEAEDAEWVVVVRAKIETGDVAYYALHGSELQKLADDFPERTSWGIDAVLNELDWAASGSARNQRPSGVSEGPGPSGKRIVDFDSSGRAVAIGENEPKTAQHKQAKPRVAFSKSKRFDFNPTPFNLGPTRGGPKPESGLPPLPGPLDSITAGIGRKSEEADTAAPIEESAAPETQSAAIQVTLSAETKAEIAVGASEVVDFRVELTSGAKPLAMSLAAAAKPDVKIVVMISAESDVIEVIKEKERTVDPPTAGEPRYGYFLVKALRPGLCRLAVTFCQGGSVIGVIGLAVAVVDAGARSLSASGSAIAETREPADDDKLALLIEQRNDGGQMVYEYTLHSETLGLQYRKLRSKPLLDRGGGVAASLEKFVENIYAKVTGELKSRNDANMLARQTRALGASLSQELFDPDVVRVLWPLRDQIKLIQIVSWEPYIPWELVRLRDPASGDIDDRFLAEYGLVRTLSDEPPARELSFDDLSYYCAKFPGGSEPEIGDDLDLSVFRAHGTRIKNIETGREAFYDVIADGDFDVLHISCHAQSEHQSMERASLILGDETTPGASKPRLIEVDTETVKAESKRWGRRPLVFLNACETGRVGAVLTDWGGWPNIFLRAGAGAFVGTSWAVRDIPASAFAKAFYAALLNGKTLAEAASEARSAAKALGDSSWLAFKVYGYPLARRWA